MADLTGCNSLMHVYSTCNSYNSTNYNNNNNTEQDSRSHVQLFSGTEVFLHAPGAYKGGKAAHIAAESSGRASASIKQHGRGGDS